MTYTKTASTEQEFMPQSQFTYINRKDLEEKLEEDFRFQSIMKPVKAAFQVKAVLVFFTSQLTVVSCQISNQKLTKTTRQKYTKTKYNCSGPLTC